LISKTCRIDAKKSVAAKIGRCGPVRKICFTPEVTQWLRTESCCYLPINYRRNHAAVHTGSHVCSVHPAQSTPSTHAPEVLSCQPGEGLCCISKPNTEPWTRYCCCVIKLSGILKTSPVHANHHNSRNHHSAIDSETESECV